MDDLQIINKRIQFLKYYFIAAILMTGFLILVGFQQVDKTSRLKELTVEKINVIDNEGSIRVILAGSFPPRRSELAGLLFVNQEGTEAGGLVYTGQTKGGQISANAALTMDQYNNDQIVAIQYDEENGKRKHGLTIADRPDILSPEVIRVYGILDTMPEGPKRDSLSKELFAKIPPGQVAARRVFVGRNLMKASIVELSDRNGKPRLQLLVDSLGNPKINFLDTNGHLVKTISQ
jgi:hypothetical protein